MTTCDDMNQTAEDGKRENGGYQRKTRGGKRGGGGGYQRETGVRKWGRGQEHLSKKNMRWTELEKEIKIRELKHNEKV